MQASETVLTEYGLDDYTLLSASDAAMTAAIDRAVRRDEWIVATAWNPHWMFASWDLRYLEDPKGVLGGGEEVHGIDRAGFEEDYPQAAAFLFNYKLDLAELETIMLEATKTSSEEAAAAYLEAHPELIDEWVKPALDKPKFGP
jgi:glycine betaine/proline transport system substrate-binding protein